MPLLSAREGETIAERLDRIETNLQQVHSRSAANIKLMKEGERQRDRQDALLARRLTETERKVTAFAKELAVDGIRLAVLGLLFLATGLALQALAAWL